MSNWKPSEDSALFKMDVKELKEIKVTFNRILVTLKDSTLEKDKEVIEVSKSAIKEIDLILKNKFNE